MNFKIQVNGDEPVEDSSIRWVFLRKTHRMLSLFSKKPLNSHLIFFLYNPKTLSKSQILFANLPINALNGCLMFFLYNRQC